MCRPSSLVVLLEKYEYVAITLEVNGSQMRHGAIVVAIGTLGFVLNPGFIFNPNLNQFVTDDQDINLAPVAS